MQLGTRWPFGSPDRPERLPEVVLAALDQVEADAGAHADWRWTLTWLESKPVIELDDGTVIRYDAAADAATITFPSTSTDDEDDW